MKILKVSLEDNSHKDIYVPSQFTYDEATKHLNQLFGTGSWYTYRECTL